MKNMNELYTGDFHKQENEKSNLSEKLDIANQEINNQKKDKKNRHAELLIANKELIFQNEEKEKRAAELIIANKELAYQNKEKEKRANELLIANKELAYQNTEKEKRAEELIIANKELAYQNEEKEKRAAELIVANKELAYQNTEKEKRAKELLIANKELRFQNKEKGKRAAELIIANKELLYQNGEKEKRMNESIYMSNHDHLSNLYNRRYYEQELQKLDKKENLPITIMMSDINGLKLINDSFGHLAGDNMIKVMADVLTKSSLPSDLVARIGGDEFVIVMTKSDFSSAELVIEHVKNLLLADTTNKLKITASFGYETKYDINQDIRELFQGAENQMYRHKLSESNSMRSKTIDLIMSTLFEINPREAEHSKRVGSICEHIAMSLGLSDANIHEMKIAGLMHDIGKIGVSENILNKHGKLTSEEWLQIKKHPEIGYRILSSSHEFATIAEYILAHHEKWDGSGYPKGLKKEEISLPSRIIALADSYDAMTSERTYKEKMTDEAAIIEIQRCSGSHFDPTVVNAFINNFSSMN